MKELNKYHKQSFPKDLKKELDRYNKKYHLKLDTSLLSYFYIMAFKTGLRNKTVFEKTFENFRNSQLDLWDNISFNERNLLLSHTLDPIKGTMPQFEFEGSTIFIPFFDVLMNNLYDRETAILELPQFFKLYNDFDKSIIDMKLYGYKPFIHHMTDLLYVTHTDPCVVLYFDQINTFYRIENDSVVEFPFYDKRELTSKTITEMGHLILNNAEDDVILAFASEEKMLHPRLVKKIQRRK